MSDPRSILPEEAWNIILNGVINPQDILSCSQTCTLFRSYLSPTRTTWAFPAVLPSLLEFLSKKDVLQCRLVSKSWLKAIDNFLQSDQFAPILVQQLRNYEDMFSNNFLTLIPRHQLDNPDGIRELFQGEMRNWQVDQNGDLIPGPPDRLRAVAEGEHQNHEIRNRHQNELEEFISVFGDGYEKNPFPSRAVVLIITDTNIDQTLQFLNLFGPQIWSLGIVVELTTLGMYQILELFWKILNRVSNLKHLFIGKTEDHVFVFQRNLDNNLNAFLETNETPVLRELKWIELEIRNQNIHEILVDAFDDKSITIMGFFGGIKPHHISENDWKRLSLELHAGASADEWTFHVLSFYNIHLPLESIELRYSRCDDLEMLFEILSKYGSTLRRLTLTFTNLKKHEFIEMRKQVNELYFNLLFQMKCLMSFNMVLSCENSTIEFRQFVDEILDTDLIDKYLKMGGTISGFRRYGFACISAGLKTKFNGSSKMKRKYFTDGKFCRRLEVIED